MVFSTCSHATWRKARKNCASLRKKRVSPHVLRHAAAMELLQAGVDRAVIALWLGHESVETTQIYLDADLALKEQALAKTNPVKGRSKTLSTGRRVAGLPQTTLIQASGLCRMLNARCATAPAFLRALERLRFDPRGIVREAA